MDRYDWADQERLVQQDVISTFNGDDASQAVQFYAPENWQGSIYQYFSAVVSGSIRINYRMVYVYE